MKRSVKRLLSLASLWVTLAPTTSASAQDVGNVAAFDTSVKVLQIVGKKEMLVVQRSTGQTWLIEGLVTEKLADDDVFQLNYRMVYAGTKSYTTVLGAKKTVRCFVEEGEWCRREREKQEASEREREKDPEYRAAKAAAKEKAEKLAAETAAKGDADRRAYQAAKAAGKKDDRRYWRFGKEHGPGYSSSFEKQVNGSWLETRPSGEKVGVWKELRRTDDYVEMRDAQRNLTIRLGFGKAWLKSGSGVFNGFPGGNWESANHQADTSDASKEEATQKQEAEKLQARRRASLSAAKQFLHDAEKIKDSEAARRSGEAERLMDRALARLWSIVKDHPGTPEAAEAAKLLGLKPVPIAEKPKPIDAAPKSVETAYLVDLTEKVLSALDNGFIKNWEGVVNGKKAIKALLLHPPDKGTAYVTYDIGKRFQMFKATVGISDGANGGNGSKSALTFSVVGDGKVLWRSKPLRKAGQVGDCDIRIEGVGQLTLRVHCPGSNYCAHAVWVESRLIGENAVTTGGSSPKEEKPRPQPSAKQP